MEYNLSIVLLHIVPLVLHLRTLCLKKSHEDLYPVFASKSFTILCFRLIHSGVAFVYSVRLRSGLAGECPSAPATSVEKTDFFTELPLLLCQNQWATFVWGYF